MTELPDLTVVVPSYFSSKTLERCLSSIKNQNTQIHYTVLVFHSGHEPIPNYILNQFNNMNFHIVEDRWLPGRVRNWALHHAVTAWVLFVDADCVLDLDYIETMMSLAKKQPIDGLGGCVRNENPCHIPGFVMHQLEFSEWMERGKLNTSKNFPTCNALYRRSALLDIGGFQEDVFPSEDTIANHLMTQSGYALLFFSGCGVHHIHQKSWWDVIRYNYLHGTTYGHASNKYNLQGHFLHTLPNLLTIGLVVGVRYFRITRRLVSHKRNEIIPWIICTPYTLICLFAWAIGFVQHEKYKES